MEDTGNVEKSLQVEIILGVNSSNGQQTGVQMDVNVPLHLR